GSAAGKAEGDVAEVPQARAEPVVLQGQDPDPGPPAMEVEHDRQDLDFVEGLDLVAIAPEAPAHPRPGAGLDLDMDQERAVVVSQEGHRDEEVQLPPSTSGGEELLVEEHRSREVELARQVWHGEP